MPSKNFSAGRPLPPGGDTGDVLTKASPGDQDAEWSAPSVGGGGLTLTQSDTDPGAVGAGNFWLEARFGNGTDDGGYGRLWVRNSTDTGWNSAGPTTFADATRNLITSPGDNAELRLDDAGTSYLTDPTSLTLRGSSGILFLDAGGVHVGSGSSAPAFVPGSADPTAGGGVAAPVGSIYLRTNGTLWQKIGAGDTAWTLVGSAPLSSATPLVDSGTGSAGSGTAASKDDHVHPAAASSLQVNDSFTNVASSDTIKFDPASASVAVITEDPAGTAVVTIGAAGLAAVLAKSNDPAGYQIIATPADGGLGGRLNIAPAPGGGNGGIAEMTGGDGALGADGGYVNIAGGNNGGVTNGAIVTVGPALAADHGYLAIRTDNSFGTGTQFLGSDGNSQVVWRDPAASVADIADPSSATAEDVANKINALMASLRTAGLLAA